MTTWDNLDKLPKEQRHCIYQDLFSESDLRKYAEYVVDAARDLEQYLFKVLGGEQAGLSLVGEDLYAQGAKDRLQELRSRIAEFDEQAYRRRAGKPPAKEVE